MIDRFKRYQDKLNLEHLYPKNAEGLCRCGCGEKVQPPKRSWLSEKHRDVAYTRYCIIKGMTDVVRVHVYKRDQGVCAACGTKVLWSGDWQADHIIEVRHGGGGCELDNYQTLCTPVSQGQDESELQADTTAA